MSGQRAKATDNIHYLDAGIYTVPDVAHFVRASHAQVRGWVEGHAKSKAPPIVLGEFERLGWRATMSFKNLIEALFIKCFADEGFTIQAIRLMAEEARRFFNDPHPFARNVAFKTDGKYIFADFWDELQQKRGLYNLKNHNHAIDEIMRPFLREPPEYGADGYAKLWRPRRDVAPNVILNPVRSFGQPIIAQSGVPVRTLVDALKAERGNYRKVARWYEVSEDQVKEAERFENAA
jgi:uncharacterized protein (DUF433 family)